MSLFGRLFGASEQAGDAPRPATPRAGDVAISVVVPLYNHARYIGAALESVLAQTAPAFDIVVIDDGSSDDGAALAEAVLRDHKPARVIRQENAGAHAALNRGIDAARGEWIAVLNSDDIFEPEKLARCQELLAVDPPPRLIAGRVVPIDAEGHVQERGVAVDWLARAAAFAAHAPSAPLALLNENDIATTSNMVFTRSMWLEAGGFVALRYCHDLDFLMQAYALGRVTHDRGPPHVRYRVHAGNTIGEDINAVRLEIAAVVAQTLHARAEALLGEDADAALPGFIEFLRNKAMSEVVLYLMALRRRFANRRAFYAHVTAEPQRGRLIAQLRGN
jgi:glycosyltransferase involved in cell wall biosynthesis